MPLDMMPYGDPFGPMCNACKLPIAKDERATRIHFATDPEGMRGLTGDYHLACSRPFEALARVVNLTPWSRF
jgi:hypothetical protein